jgi:Mg2+/Co2+ transporter CorC
VRQRSLDLIRSHVPWLPLQLVCESHSQIMKILLTGFHFDTIGGLLLSKFGRIPQREDHIRIGDLDFKVLNADNRQVRLLHVTLRDSREDVEL